MSFYLRSSSRQELRAVWSHSVATAVLAEHIVAVTAWSSPGFYTAGLVHDVGSPGLLLTSYDRYAGLIALKLVDVEEAARIERALFGVSHAEAGAFLADTWGFPAPLRRCISDHHGNVREADDLLLYVVQLACRLASSLGFPEAFVMPGQRTEDPMEVLPPDLGRPPEVSMQRLQDLIAAHMDPSPTYNKPGV